MKKIATLLIAFSFTLFVKGQQQFSNKQHELQQVIVNVFQALSNRDSIALKSYCFPDVTFYEYGQIWNIDTLISKAIKNNRTTDYKRTNTFDFINVEIDKAQAWLTYRLTSIIVKDSNEVSMQWLETVVVAIYDKHWKVKHLHSTLLKKS